MNRNEQFIDIMNDINNIAKGKGFTNGKQWAIQAHKEDEISSSAKEEYINIHNLRNNYSHGHAREIDISSETLGIAKQMKKAISRSSLSSNQICNNYHLANHEHIDYDNASKLSYVAQQIARELIEDNIMNNASDDEIIDAAVRVLERDYQYDNDFYNLAACYNFREPLGMFKGHRRKVYTQFARIWVAHLSSSDRYNLKHGIYKFDF